MRSMNVFQTSVSGASPLNLKDISEAPSADARRIMSEEHKALGYRPPPGSLASQAQAAIARHESRRADEHALTLDEEQIRQAVLADAERIKQQRGNTNGNGGTASASGATVDLNAVGEAEARKLMSDEHKALGYRPPPGSLASEAQSAAAKHPDASGGIDSTILAKAALEDATHIAGNGGTSNLDVNNVGEAEARKLMSEEHRALGYRPPTGSLAAAAQAAAAKHPDASAGVDQATLAHAALEDAQKIASERGSNGNKDDLSQVPVTKEMASSLVSQEHKALGHLPESGSVPATAQSLADKNEQDGGERTLGEAGACM
ncbi:hypothetical protein GY45DRAFT_82188 [Cubamyces sp. BRFM 1775]|nr:hypothetical protein GY45DRAFT_82188 [Cubamyces sp. BRFM 1775]